MLQGHLDRVGIRVDVGTATTLLNQQRWPSHFETGESMDMGIWCIAYGCKFYCFRQVHHAKRCPEQCSTKWP